MKSLLFALIALVGVSAVVSGLLLVARPDGSILYLPLSMLATTPFKDFLVPGLALTIVVGGVNLAAVFFNLQRHPDRYNWSLAGGVVITGWIIVQVIMIESLHWLHFIYLGAGILILLLSLQLKGKWAV